MDLSEYRYLWTTEKQDWVLVNTSFGYGIVNKTEQIILSVSDKKLEQALIEQMLSNGCKIYDNIKDAYNDAPGRALLGEDIVLCEKCGYEMNYHREGSCCGMTCPNCGWGWATTYIEPIHEDDTDYHIILSVPCKNLLDNIRMIAGTANCNYIKSKKLIAKAPAEIFCGKAVDVKTIKVKLEKASIEFRIEPEFPY